MSDSMSLDKQESGTALAAAFIRALAACDPREELRGKDQLAEIFLREEQKRPLAEAAARAWIMKNKVTPGVYDL